MIGAIGMRFTKRAKIWVLIGVPLCVFGQGLQLYFVNIDGERSTNESYFIVAEVLVGVGCRLYQTAAQVAVQAVVERDEIAIATGVFSASMNLGGSIGTIISGAIWRSNLAPKLMNYLSNDTKGQASAILGSIAVAQKHAAGTPERVAIDQAYRETQWLLAIAATCVLGPMMIAMWFIKNFELSDDDAMVEQESCCVSQESEAHSQAIENMVGEGPEKSEPALAQHRTKEV